LVAVAVLFLLLSAFALAQSPKAATYITAEHVKAVNVDYLSVRPGPDRMLPVGYVKR